MNRRTLLRGGVAAAAGTAAALTGAGTAQAASYSVVAAEQTANKIYVWPTGRSLTEANSTWTWSPGGGGWYNLSDVRLRNTAAHAWVVLVAASGGRVGIVNHTSERNAELNDLLWYASPGGNPHAAERIENNGSIVTASSAGYLTLYSPTAISRPSTLARVATISAC